MHVRSDLAALQVVDILDACFLRTLCVKYRIVNGFNASSDAVAFLDEEELLPLLSLAVLLSPDTSHQWLLNEGYSCQTVSGVKKGHLLTFDCQVGGVPVVLAFDSGAQSNLLASDWPQLHPTTVKGIKKTHLTGYGDGRASITKGKTTLTLGERAFKKQQTAFSNVPHLKESKGIDGLFGCEVLAKQKLLISYKRQELILVD